MILPQMHSRSLSLYVGIAEKLMTLVTRTTNVVFKNKYTERRTLRIIHRTPIRTSYTGSLLSPFYRISLQILTSVTKIALRADTSLRPQSLSLTPVLNLTPPTNSCQLNIKPELNRTQSHFLRR